MHLGISKADLQGSFVISGAAGSAGSAGSGGSGGSAGTIGKGRGAGRIGAGHTCGAGTTAFEMHVHGLATGGGGKLAPHPHLLIRNACQRKRLAI